MRVVKKPGLFPAHECGRTPSRLTPTTDDVPAFCQKTTPVKARIKGTVDFLKSEGIKTKNEAIFHYNGVSCATRFRILRSSNPRTLKNDDIRKETRGRKSLISFQETHEMEKLLENEGLEGRALTWGLKWDWACLRL